MGAIIAGGSDLGGGLGLLLHHLLSCQAMKWLISMASEAKRPFVRVVVGSGKASTGFFSSHKTQAPANHLFVRMLFKCEHLDSA